MADPNQWSSTKLWIAANRQQIGLAIAALATLIRVSLTFQGHSETADFLKSIADLFIAGGAYTAGSGLHESDTFYKEMKVREELGLPERRGADRKETVAELEARLKALKDEGRQ